MTDIDVTLNAWEQNFVQVLAVQGESEGRTINATLVDRTGLTDGTYNAESIDRPIDLTDATVRLYCKKPDGMQTLNDGTVTDPTKGKASFVLPKQATAVAGNVSAQIYITKADNSVLKVIGLTLQVQESDIDSIESSDEYDSLVKALNSVEKAASDAKTAVSTCNDATQAANTATSVANTATTNANTAADNANSKATLADTAAAKADDKASAAQTAADNANAAAKSANDAATAANTSKTDCDTATAAANTAAQSANDKASVAGTATEAANTAADNANGKASAADTAATSANTAAKAANDAKSACDTATQAANTATASANTAADSANSAADKANTAAENVDKAIQGDIGPAVDEEILKKVDKAGGLASYDNAHAHYTDQTAHVTTLACTKTNTVYDLTGLTATSGIVSCVFKADADYAEGDTFTVEGEAVTAQQQNGDSIDDGCFKSGAVVPCIYDVDNKTLNFKQSGGTKLNLFVQPDEPATKDGIWIKAPEKHKVKNITGKNSFTIGGEARTYDSSLNANLGNGTNILLSYNNDVYNVVATDDYNALGLYIYRWNPTTNATTTVYSKSDSLSGYCDASAVAACIKGDILYAAVSCAFNGNCHTIVAIYNLKTGTSTATSYSSDILTGLSDSEETAYFEGFLGYNDTTAYYVSYSHTAGTDDYALRFYAYNFVTHARTPFKSVTVDINGGCAEGVVVDDKLYYQYFTGSGKSYINIWDLTTGTTTTQSLGYTLYPSTSAITAYNNKLYARCTDSATSLHEFEIGVWTNRTISGFAIDINEIVKVGTSLAIKNSTHMQYYDFISETLPENSLAILDGISRITKLISSGKMNYIRMVFQDVWWYDTDFKEYPTYIGNGTSWTKIKN